MLADLDDVVELVLVLQQDHEAVEVVADQVLGAEGDGQADDGRTAEQGGDRDADLLEDHQDARR